MFSLNLINTVIYIFIKTKFYYCWLTLKVNPGILWNVMGRKINNVIITIISIILTDFIAKYICLRDPRQSLAKNIISAKCSFSTTTVETCGRVMRNACRILSWKLNYSYIYMTRQRCWIKLDNNISVDIYDLVCVKLCGSFQLDEENVWI